MERKVTTDDILNKEFSTKKFNGIDPAEVDDFLNAILDDIEALEAENENLKAQNEQLRQDNFKIRMSSLKNESTSSDLTQEVEFQHITTADMKNETAKLEVIDYTGTLSNDEGSTINLDDKKELTLEQRVAIIEEELEVIKERM